MAESDENRDEDFEIEEPAAEGEETTETSTDDAEESDEGEGDTDATEEGDEGEGDDEKDEFVIPEKFKGKDAKEVAKSYVELEKSINKKASDMARDMIAKQRPSGKTTKSDDSAIKEAMKGVDFTAMKPEQFAEWLIKTVETRAQEIARNTYEAADNTKTQVQTEINTVTKSWPQLKENEGFRNMVLALIENSANKGEILTLKEACTSVGKALGQKATAKPATATETGAGGEKTDKTATETKPRPKTGVERATGTGGGEKQSDEERVLSGLMSGKTPSGLSGLY